MSNKRRRHAAKRRRAFPRTYVNAYEVDQVFGGREEGGWWFDAGVPLASVQVRTVAGITRTRERLRAAFAWIQGARPRHNTNGGPDVEIYIEEGPAASFPARRPHYE